VGAQVRWRAPAVVAKGQLATWRGPRVRCTTSLRDNRCGIRATTTASGSVAAMGFGEARVVVGRGSLGDPSDAHMRRCQGHPRPSRGGRIRRPEHLRSELNPVRRRSPRWGTMASSEEVRGGRRSGSPARLHRGREPPTPNVAQRPAGGRRGTLLAISRCIPPVWLKLRLEPRGGDSPALSRPPTASPSEWLL